MSGQFPRTCGCEIFAQDLPVGHMTFARRFSQYAYHTVAAGKLHHTGTDQMLGWSQRIGSAMQVAPHFVAGRDEDSYSQSHERAVLGEMERHERGTAGRRRPLSSHNPG